MGEFANQNKKKTDALMCKYLLLVHLDEKLSWKPRRKSVTLIKASTREANFILKTENCGIKGIYRNFPLVKTQVIYRRSYWLWLRNKPCVKEILDELIKMILFALHPQIFLCNCFGVEPRCLQFLGPPNIFCYRCLRDHILQNTSLE